MPRNAYIKIYNQLQYSLFDLSNFIVGKNSDIFEYNYICSELCFNGCDYSLYVKDLEMEEYVSTLCEIEEKLKKINKNLIVYTTPSKANWHLENIPKCYQVQAINGVRGIDSFREKIKSKNIKYVDADQLLKRCAYPVFYNTGIHWSRPAEEEISVEIINEIKSLTKRDYRNIELGIVQESYIPYWRDSDVYDIQNLIFPAEKNKYYQYDIGRQVPEQFDKLRLLLQGGSFAQGLLYDYFDTYSGDEVYYSNFPHKKVL